MANTEVGAAYVSVYPDTSNFSARVASQLNNGALDRVGQQLGQRIANSMGRGFGSASGVLSALGGKLSRAFTAFSKPAIGALGGISTALLGITAQKGWTRALNIEGANRIFKGLGFSAEEMASAMDSANNAVLGTAFGLDEAAQAASLLATSGVALGDDMDRALRGIAGTASMAGTSMADITSIFQEVAASGKVTGTALRRLSERGVNAVDALAKHLNVSQAEVKKLVSQGKVSFKDFSDAMYEAFGEAAYNANETFAGALMNVQAALGRLGQKFATPLQESLRKVFVSAIPAVDALSKSMGGLVERFSALTDKYLGKVAAGFDAFRDSRTLSVDEKGKRTYKETAVELADLQAAMDAVFGPGMAAKIEQAATAIGLFAAAGPALKLMGAGVKAFSPLATAFDKLSSFKGGAVSSSIGQAASDAATMFKLHWDEGIGKKLNLGSAFASLKADTKSLAKGLFNNSFVKEVGGGFVNALGTAFKVTPFGKLASVAGDVFGAMGPGLSKAASSAGNAIKNGLGKGVNIAGKGLIAMTGAAAGLSVGLMALGAAAIRGNVDIAGFAAKITENMTLLTQNMGTVVSQLATQLPVAAQQIAAQLPALMSAIVEGLRALVPVLLQLIPTLVTALNEIITALVPVIIELLPVILEAGMQLFLGLLQALVETAPLIIEQLPTLIAGFGQVIIDNFPLILSAGLQLFVAIVKAVVQTAPQVIAELWNLLKQLPGKVLGFVGEMFSAGANLIGGLIDGIGSAIGGVVDTIMGGLSGAIEKVKAFLGIASPSKLFRYFGNMTVAGMIQGVDDRAEELYSTMAGVTSRFADEAQASMAFDYTAASGDYKAVGNDQYVFNITADSETTLQQLVKQAQRMRIAYGGAY